MKSFVAYPSLLKTNHLEIDKELLIIVLNPQNTLDLILWQMEYGMHLYSIFVILIIMLRVSCVKRITKGEGKGRELDKDSRATSVGSLTTSEKDRNNYCQ